MKDEKLLELLSSIKEVKAPQNLKNDIIAKTKIVKYVWWTDKKLYISLATLCACLLLVFSPVLNVMSPDTIQPTTVTQMKQDDDDAVSSNDNMKEEQNVTIPTNPKTNLKLPNTQNVTQSSSQNVVDTVKNPSTPLSPIGNSSGSVVVADKKTQPPTSVTQPNKPQDNTPVQNNSPLWGVETGEPNYKSPNPAYLANSPETDVTPSPPPSEDPNYGKGDTPIGVPERPIKEPTKPIDAPDSPTNVYINAA